MWPEEVAHRICILQSILLVSLEPQHDKGVLGDPPLEYAALDLVMSIEFSHLLTVFPAWSLSSGFVPFTVLSIFPPVLICLTHIIKDFHLQCNSKAR